MLGTFRYLKPRDMFLCKKNDIFSEMLNPRKLCVCGVAAASKATFNTLFALQLFSLSSVGPKLFLTQID